MTGMAAIVTNTTTANVVPADRSQTALLDETSADIISNADIISEVEMSVESVADNVVELAGEIISNVLNG